MGASSSKERQEIEGAWSSRGRRYLFRPDTQRREEDVAWSSRGRNTQRQEEVERFFFETEFLCRPVDSWKPRHIKKLNTQRQEEDANWQRQEKKKGKKRKKQKKTLMPSKEPMDDYVEPKPLWKLDTESTHDVLSRCKLFEDTLVKYFEEKLEKYGKLVKTPGIGKKTAAVAKAGQVLSCGIAITAGATVALTIATADATTFAAGTETGTVIVANELYKYFRRRQTRRITEVTKKEVLSVLVAIVHEAGKELSRIYEYQLAMLKDDTMVEVLAKSAVDAMLDPKKKDTFDANALVNKVMTESSDRKKLKTREGKQWRILSIFKKPGLRKVEEDHRAPCKTYHYSYWRRERGYRKQKSRVEKYGYRAEVFKIRDQEHGENGDGGEDSRPTACGQTKHFEGGEIDQKFKVKVNETPEYRPLHCLLLSPADLQQFALERNAHSSLTKFAAKMYKLDENQLIKPVYRPKELGKVLNLSNTDLRGSDFTRADFSNYELERCDFSKCTVLFGRFEKTNLRGAKFTQSYLSNCFMEAVDARNCEWTQVKVLYCDVSRCLFDDCVNNLGGNDWEGTNFDEINDEVSISSENEVTISSSDGVPVSASEAQLASDEDSTDEEPTWFENHLMDGDNMNINKPTQDIMSSLPWVSGFALAWPNKVMEDYHLLIYVRKDVEKSTSELISELAKELRATDSDIATWVKFCRVTKDVKAKFLVDAKPGTDIIFNDVDTDNPLSVRGTAEELDNGSVSKRGTLTAISHLDEQHNVAITCFHVGCSGALNSNFGKSEIEKFRGLFKEYVRLAGRPSEQQRQATYHFSSRADAGDNNENYPSGTLGIYHRGLFDEKSDILLIKILPEVRYSCTFQNLSNKWGMTKYERKKKGGKIAGTDVVKITAEGPTKGTLCGVVATHDDIPFKDFYTVSSTNSSESFLKDGDSGCLICKIDGEGKLRPFAYGVCASDLSAPGTQENAGEAGGPIKLSSSPYPHPPEKKKKKEEKEIFK